MVGACGREDDNDGCSGGGCSQDCSASATRNQVCIKCKEAPPVALANQTEPVCSPCLRAGIVAKFKTVLNTQAFVSLQDKVLVAFSGGTGSRVVLELAVEMRQEALASRALNAPAFDLGVVFVDEGVALGLSMEERQSTSDRIRSVATGVFTDNFHAVKLEEVYCSEEEESRAEKLQRLLESIKDETGKEDMTEILRMQLLEQFAGEHGYTKILLGSSATRVASRVVSAVAKGQGYALPASVHYVDARWCAPVVLPVRDCSSKELALLCHYSALETVLVKGFSTMRAESASINSLCDAFVRTLKQDNSARDHTIVRTAAKSIPFSFNRLLVAGTGGNSRRRRGIERSVPVAEMGEDFCSICRAPLKKQGSAWCGSCRFQFLAGIEGGQVQKALPGAKPRALLESEIQEYLL